MRHYVLLWLHVLVVLLLKTQTDVSQYKQYSYLWLSGVTCLQFNSCIRHSEQSPKCSLPHLFLSLLTQWCSPLLPNAPLSPKLNNVPVSRSLSPAWRPWQEGQHQTPAACLRHSAGDQQALFDQLCASSRTASKCWIFTSQTAWSVNAVKLTQNKVLHSFTPETIREEELNILSHYQATCLYCTFIDTPAMSSSVKG